MRRGVEAAALVSETIRHRIHADDVFRAAERVLLRTCVRRTSIGEGDMCRRDGRGVWLWWGCSSGVYAACVAIDCRRHNACRG